MNRIVITGPESSGKSSLAKALAEEFNVAFVPEFARFYLESKGTNYQLEDLVNIAIGQVTLAESIEAEHSEKSLLLIDTWILEIRVWAQYRFGVVPDVVEEMYNELQPDFYLLSKPDMPWEEDPLRENPYDRDVLFELYHQAIVKSAIPYAIVEGIGEARVQMASASIRQQFSAILTR